MIDGLAGQWETSLPAAPNPPGLRDYSRKHRWRGATAAEPPRPVRRDLAATPPPSCAPWVQWAPAATLFADRRTTPAPKSGQWVRAATIETFFNNPSLTPRPKSGAHGGARPPPSPFPTVCSWAPTVPVVICFGDPRMTRATFCAPWSRIRPMSTCFGDPPATPGGKSRPMGTGRHHVHIFQ